jgi:hypothetical protein
MHIHQTRKNEMIAEVDDSNLAVEVFRISESTQDLANNIVFHNDRLSAQGGLARNGQQFSGVDQRNIRSR